MHYLFCSKGIIDAKYTAIKACKKNARGRAISVFCEHAEIIKYCIGIIGKIKNARTKYSAILAPLNIELRKHHRFAIAKRQ